MRAVSRGVLALRPSTTGTSDQALSPAAGGEITSADSTLWTTLLWSHLACASGALANPPTTTAITFFVVVVVVVVHCSKAFLTSSQVTHSDHLIT
jgi:hypothetical protein